MRDLKELLAIEPFSIISAGPQGSWIPGVAVNFDHADEAVAYATFLAATPALFAALELILNRYVGLAESGDCGFWNPEDEPEVKACRAALAKARGTP